MHDQDHFRELKKEVAFTFRKAFPSSPANMEEWKGQDIVNFQEELMQKVQGRLSEKWFYTHIKGSGEKLPRIDMLNLLSQYAGYQGWSDFTSKKSPVAETLVENRAEADSNFHSSDPIIQPSHTSKPASKKKRIPFIIGGCLVLGVVLVFGLFGGVTRTYTSCFVDMDGRAPVANARIEVFMLSYDESPVLKVVDKNGCMTVQTNDDKVRFVITSPYYWPDTVTRLLNGSEVHDRIKLRTNDYALMIHYFSSSKVSDWKKRRMQLDDMIADNAKIYQVYNDNRGMELYNKEEFINKLTIPIKSLRTIEVIETKYTAGRIVELRFRQNDDN